ncbi:unnamed protein product [Haemonchus placei]|uniref:Uncharacterized protein n=1 Tax=Haemonchus placei TaxID=6290 RepID=A0A0N4WJW1_HAEPC|nr:unnamed protein product [Haemonchus placei]
MDLSANESDPIGERAPGRPKLRWADPMMNISASNGNDVRRAGTDGLKSTCVNGEVCENKSDTGDTR